jgi:hypothetical protein
MSTGHVEDKEFLSQPMDCKAVGFITVEGGCTNTRDGKRIKTAEGTVVRVTAKVWRANGNGSKKTRSL